MKDLPEKERRALLNQETGKIAWPDLQTYFARGVLVKVAAELDLVTVADQFIVNDKETIEAWYDKQLIMLAADDCATQWSKQQTVFWAIVVAPWVLVQEIVPVNT